MNAAWRLRAELWRGRAAKAWALVRPQPAAKELFAEPWPAIAVDHAGLIAALTPGAHWAETFETSALHLVLPGAPADAADGAQQLLDEGYRARRDTAPWPLRIPIAWDADPFNDRNWRTQLNTLRPLDLLISAHDLRPANGFLETALVWALDWHRFHITEQHDHPFAWRDMMTGIRSLRLVYLADRVRRGALAASAEQRTALAEALLVHWQRLTAPGFFRYSNHTIWDLHGLTAIVRLALEPTDSRHAAWTVAIGRHLDHLVDMQFDAHGVHRENSPQYHFVASGMFRVLADSGWYQGLSSRLGPRLEAARAVDAWMRLPDKRHIPIGDSDGAPPRRSSRLPSASADSAGDRVEWMNQSCYCFVRRTDANAASRWSFLGVKAGFTDVGHKHQDDLSYLWSESGCDIVVDPGKYSYDQNPMRDYFKSNRAHNLIEFGGQENDHRPRHRSGHAVRSCKRTSWGLRIETRIHHKPAQVEHERIFDFAPGRWLVVVDHFVAARPVAFTHWTHFAPELALHGEGESIIARHRAGGEVRVLRWASVPIEATIIAGQKLPRLQGWISRQYRVAEPCQTLGLAGLASRASIVLALSLDPAASLRRQANGRIEWACADAAFTFDVFRGAAG